MGSIIKGKPATFLQAGFSLVELSMVLLIIGLIAGGIMKGQELLESARLKSVLSQVNEYRTATHIFLERYGSLPGDYSQAQENISGTLKNGNGDGIISGPGLSTTGDGHEALSFWAHLAEANMITSPGEMPSSGNAHFGQGAPSSKIGGGFTVQYNFQNSGSHWFVLGHENGDSNNKVLLTPHQASSLDRKTDTGNGLTGDIRAADGAGKQNEKCLAGNGSYNLAVRVPACVVYFRMN